MDKSPPEIDADTLKKKSEEEEKKEEVKKKPEEKKEEKKKQEGKKEEKKSEEKASSSSQDEASKLRNLYEPSTSKDDESAIETIRRYMAEKLGFLDDPKKKVLEEVSFAGVVKYIKSGHCHNILVMAGAGISTSAGIPDFRSPNSGLYSNLAKYKLPHPQAIFEIEFFQENPKPFYELAKELFPGTYKPTPAHYFIKLLHEKNLLLRHYTQNIDGLEKVAGIPADKIVEAHGTFYTSHCLICRKKYSLEWMKEKIFLDTVPRCEDCKGLIKPDIVFFGESLPERFFSLTKEDFPKADLLIIMGSSLVVQPFASLVDRVNATCPRLLLNREKAGHRDRLMSVFGMGGGLDLDSDKNYRDVAVLGDCDELCQRLVNELGWTNDFEQLMSMSK